MHSGDDDTETDERAPIVRTTDARASLTGMSWLFLAAAIAVELLATVGVKLSDGFTRPLIVAGVLGGYGLSFFLMSRAVKEGLEISIGYAVWSGVGTAAVALIGAAWLDEPLTWPKAAGIGLVVAGVVLLVLADRG